MSRHVVPERVKDEDSLSIFLSGTSCWCSPLSILRGQSDIIRYIWILVCEEWWDMHIGRGYTGEIPQFLEWRDRDFPEHFQQYPSDRQHAGGCPAAILATNVPFPPLLKLPRRTFIRDSQYLYVNMMPINLKNLDNLPKFCEGYLPLLKLCRSRMNTGSISFEPDVLIGYLTIDERPIDPSQPNQRGGLRIESSGMRPLVKRSSEYAYGGNFIPGTEHHSGDGIMMRDERIEGGIFIATTMPNATAVWNCRIIDRKGSVIGSHGNIERLRPLLGQSSRVLQAGELMWITDKTPLEALQLPPGAVGKRYQYFRLVVGEVTAWFADESTANPYGVTPPPEVQIIRSDSHHLSSFDSNRKLWGCGSCHEMFECKIELSFRSLMFCYDLGHCLEMLWRRGIRSCHDASQLSEEDIFDLLPAYGAHYHDIPQMIKLVNEIKSWS